MNIKEIKSMEALMHCSETAAGKCKGLEELLKKEIDEYPDVVQIANATYEALIWYYYCYSVGDVFSCLDEEFSDYTKKLTIKYFGSLSKYADFLKENLNL